MTDKKFVENLEFENITLFDRNENTTEITFQINGNPKKYCIVKRKYGEENWLAPSVFHLNEYVRCPFCVSEIRCNYLTEHAYYIYQKLKKHPSVRLHMLF
jgi:hypothetical protein